MDDSLTLLVADGIIEEVVARLKSGKEADIYLVRHAGEILAAKVYKERHARSFRSNAAYKEGRQVRDTRTQRAMSKGSRFGLAAAEEAWKVKESEALHTLHAAGVRVPRPVMFYEGVLLMEAVVDAEGHPAPRLVDATVPSERAAEHYADLRRQMVRMLACDLIHGDLSPYNVLLAWNGPTVIDFPQVVGAAHNSQAEFFFQRDLHTIRGFFARLDPTLHAAGNDAREIWRAYVRRELTPDFVPTGRREQAGGSHPPSGQDPRRGQGPPQRAGDWPRQRHPGHASRARHGSSAQGTGAASRSAPRGDHAGGSGGPTPAGAASAFSAGQAPRRGANERRREPVVQYVSRLESIALGAPHGPRDAPPPVSLTNPPGQDLAPGRRRRRHRRRSR